jgi:2,4-dienoyl-CoA reductase-like NADH-dependent reductase (Old Yellow Enzyme family)
MPRLPESDRLREPTFRNRVGVPPVCQHRARDGIAVEWALVRYGRRALMPAGPGFQSEFAARVKREAGVATAAVGLITSAAEANHVLCKGQADMVPLGGKLLRHAYWPLDAARVLDQPARWPRQHLHAARKAALAAQEAAQKAWEATKKAVKKAAKRALDAAKSSRLEPKEPEKKAH